MAPCKVSSLAHLHLKIPITAFVGMHDRDASDFGIFITNRGNLVALWSLEYLDVERKDDARMVLAQGLRGMDHRMAVHTYLLKRTVGGQRVLQRVIAFEWRTILARGGAGMPSLSCAFADCFRGLFTAEARKRLFQFVAALTSEAGKCGMGASLLEGEIADFQRTMAAFQRSLWGEEARFCLLAPLMGREALNFFWRIYNWDSGAQEPRIVPTPNYLGHWIGQVEPEFDIFETVKSGDAYLRLLSLRQQGKETSEDPLGSILGSESTVLIHSRWARADMPKKATTLGKTKKKGKNRPQESDAQVGRVGEGHWACTIVLASQDFNELDKMSDRVEITTAKNGIAFRRDEMAKTAAWWSQFPDCSHLEFMTRRATPDEALLVLSPWAGYEAVGA